MQEPEIYLKQLGIELDCLVNPERRAKLEPGLRTYVNHEVFFFSDAKAMKKFRQEPLRWCGLVTDPVNQVRFQPTPRSPQRVYMGTPYFFTAESTLVAFEATPDSFAMRKGM